MSAPKTLRTKPKRYATDDQRWRAVVSCDTQADGSFVYAVRTTGVYCRPSCGARLPRRENVRYHATPVAAERAGFRACKRCRPAGPVSSEQQTLLLARVARLLTHPDDEAIRQGLAKLAASEGMRLTRLHRVIKNSLGVSAAGLIAARRAARLRSGLAQGKSVTAATLAAGYSSPGRLYANSGRALGMNPAEFRAGGPGKSIRYAVAKCSLGQVLVAATDRGICAISLGDRRQDLVGQLRQQFDRAHRVHRDPEFATLIARVVAMIERPGAACRLPLDLQGTAFQVRVWEALQKIPAGQTRTYTELARGLGLQSAVRAVASACAANTLAVAVPCHRVIRRDGQLAGYRWGLNRKRALLERERGTATRSIAEAD